MLARAATLLDANAGAPLNQAALDAVFSLLCGDSSRAGPLDIPAREALLKVQGALPFTANPSSPHSEGRRAKAWLRRAREQVAASLGSPGVSPDDVFFVSSGTEATQTAIRTELEADHGVRPRSSALADSVCPRWILGAGDHDAHQQMAGWWQARGGAVDRIPLTAQGAPDLEVLEQLIRPETRLVSVVWVNNETGVITDVPRLARICAERGVRLHLDGAQAWGKLPLDLESCGAAWVSFSGHKIGALSGTGVLWRKPAVHGLRLGVFPGKQESGERAGTENLVGIVSLGAAASHLKQPTSDTRDWLESEILRRIPGARIYGAQAPRVGNTSCLGFEGVQKAGLVAALDLAGYCVSSGSACQSGTTEPSHVLMAMGVSSDYARAAVRVSLPPAYPSRETLESFIQALAQAVAKARTSG